MDLHSKRSQVDMKWLTQILPDAPEIAALSDNANTAAQILSVARQHNYPLADRVAQLARDKALEICDRAVAVEVLIFDRAGELAGRSDG
jgi:cobalamin biosynthesis protein CbiD